MWKNRQWARCGLEARGSLPPTFSESIHFSAQRSLRGDYYFKICHIRTHPLPSVWRGSQEHEHISIMIECVNNTIIKGEREGFVGEQPLS